ncbi:hypothetical protein ACQKK5_09745 [Brevibacillus panacihumi]|uniref:hypothetical protein n=1 Tax=Brevibacillus panacihumi TaxID=497735 RepID=UPI003D026F58
MAKNNDAKSELGKFMVVIGAVLGIAGGSIFLLNQFVFDSPKPTAVKMTTQPEVTNDAEPQPPPPVVETVNNPSVATVEPFYASLQMDEYAAVYNQNGTEKVLSFDLTKEEVKTLLGNPTSESYVDGETRSLCYQYGSLSIFFDDQDQYISYMTYEGTKEILNKPWLTSLAKNNRFRQR